ncbi:MAG: hypothetical protein AAFY42_09625, partial [Pseudomonadota bacterium]
MASGYPEQKKASMGLEMPDMEWRSLAEIRSELAFNQHRAWLYEGLVAACIELRRNGGRVVYLGGSFVDRRVEFPGDYDACFDTVGLSSSVDEALFLPDKELERKEKYRGDWLPARLDKGPAGRWLRFLGTDRNGAK